MVAKVPLNNTLAIDGASSRFTLVQKHTHDLAIDHRLQNRPPPQEVRNPDIYLVCGKFEQQRLTSLSFISLSLIFFFPSRLLDLHHRLCHSWAQKKQSNVMMHLSPLLA